MKYDPNDPRTFPVDKSTIVLANPELVRQVPDSPKNCPRPMTDIRRYIRAELGSVPELFWGRTAAINGVRFWLWGLVHEGLTYYVDVSEKEGVPLLAMGLGENLTPEQYIGLRYARAWRDPNHPDRAKPPNVQE